MEPWTCIYICVPGRKIIIRNARYSSYRRVFLMKCIPTRMRTTFLSRSVNLIIVITAWRYATRLLRERFIWGHVTSRLRRGPSARARARDVSDVMSVWRRRIGDFACIMPLSRSRRIVTMFIGCGLRERDVGTVSTAGQLASGASEKGTSFLSLFRTDTRASAFPFRKIAMIRRRFMPIHGDSRIPTETGRM